MAPLTSAIHSSCADIVGHAEKTQKNGPNSRHSDSMNGSTPSAHGWTVPSVPLPATAGLDQKAADGGSGSEGGGYFGLVVDSPAGGGITHHTHSLKNWSPASSSIKSSAARSPRPVLVENPSTPFQKQVEVLGQKSTRPKLDLSSIRPAGEAQVGFPGFSVAGHVESAKGPDCSQDSMDYFSSPTKTEAPALGGQQEWANLSLPSVLHPPTPQLSSPSPRNAQGKVRSSTLPTSPQESNLGTISPTSLRDMLNHDTAKFIMLLDVRTYKYYAESRIKSAINLCIPTTLLKRPSFTVGKLYETFASQKDKQIFSKWNDMKVIVVYDSESRDPSDQSALAAYHTLNKFSREGWKGQPYILKGGFAAFSTQHPNEVDRSPLSAPLSPNSLSLGGGDAKPVGTVFNCPLPAQQPAVNPFFSNIRQNMDLIGGVGEIPVQLPQSIGNESLQALPAWLKELACSDKGSKIVSDRFFKIEKAEQLRMQEALDVKVTYDSLSSTKKSRGVSLAGVEKGAKNRYNNIWPYDHARVKLQEHPEEDCDYVNASYVSSSYSSKKYIASQAPLPSTFRDFWSMVWEQDVRVIVMLTAEQEGGQVKSHRYWDTETFGPLQLKFIRERKVSLEPPSLKGSPKRRSMASAGQLSTSDPNVPHVIVRTLTLQHSGRPFSPLREITQLQYSSWPDFGAPAHPAHVLGLVEHTESVVRSLQGPSATINGQGTPTTRYRPVLVHCSAGCGRTGTFCTVDSVISLMKRQRIYRKRQQQDDGSDGDGNVKMRKLGLEDDDDWITRDDEDLIFKAVSEFRDQRLSMVQTLRQFVLCYETVLEWWAKQSPLDSGKRKIL